LRNREHRAARPLLSGRASFLAATLLLGCVIFTTVAGVVCSRAEHGDLLDRHVDAWIVTHLGAHMHALQLAADLGQALQVTVLTGALILLCLVARRVNGAVLAAISIPLAAGLTERVLKPLVNQPFSAYPSGRTTAIFAVIAAIAVLLTNPPKARLSSGARLSLVVAATLIGGAVCVAVVGLSYHTFTDAVAGITVGAGVVLATTLLLDSPRIRRLLALAGPAPRQPTRQGPDQAGEIRSS
jgi:membrane-associated phospholipid phosphatase